MSSLLRAVVVGIDKYGDPQSHEDADLACAQNDAREIAKLLSNSRAFRIEADDPFLLTNVQATKRKVRDALVDRFSVRGLDRNTIALFYFAGHGIIGKDDKVYLCCYDADFSNAEYGGIRLNDIYDLLTSCSAECAIAIIDACFSGGLTTRILDHVSAAEHAKKAIVHEGTKDGKNIAILAACQSSQAARESKELGHGLFTYGILKGWRDGDARDKDDSIVYLSDLATYLLKGFNNESQKPKISLNINSPIALTLPIGKEPDKNVRLGPYPPLPLPPVLPAPIERVLSQETPICQPSGFIPSARKGTEQSGQLVFSVPGSITDTINSSSAVNHIPDFGIPTSEIVGQGEKARRTPSNFRIPGPVPYNPIEQGRRQLIIFAILLIILLIIVLIFVVPHLFKG